MVDDELGSEFEDMTGGGRKGLPFVVIIIIVAVIMGAGGFVVGKIFFGGEKEQAPVEEKETPQQQDRQQKDTEARDREVMEAGEAEPQDFTSKSRSGIMALSPFTVNLNDPFGRRYVEVEINLEINNKAYIPKITENELMIPRLRDEIFMIISSKSYGELKSTSGKVALKEEIQMRVNELMKDEFGKEPVNAVYFTKFIIQ